MPLRSLPNPNLGAPAEQVNPAGLFAILQGLEAGGQPNGNISNPTGIFGGVANTPNPNTPIDQRQRPNISPYMKLILQGLGGG